MSRVPAQPEVAAGNLTVAARAAADSARRQAIEDSSLRQKGLDRLRQAATELGLVGALQSGAEGHPPPRFALAGAGVHPDHLRLADLAAFDHLLSTGVRRVDGSLHTLSGGRRTAPRRTFAFYDTSEQVQGSTTL